MKMTNPDRHETLQLVAEVARGLIDDSEFDAPDDAEVARLKKAARRPPRRASVGDLLHDLWTDGVVLHAEASALAALRPGAMAPWAVVRFSLKDAPPRDRVRLSRRLHGQRGQPGVIRLPGLDLAHGAALVPPDQSRSVRDALDEAGARYDIVEVWRES